MEKTIICTVCPQGCRIAVAGEGSRIESVTGFSYPLGKAYAGQLSSGIRSVEFGAQDEGMKTARFAHSKQKLDALPSCFFILLAYVKPFPYPAYTLSP